MTTLSSTSITANQTPAISRKRVALVALWLTQIALAAMFVFAGGLKLTGAPEMVGLFDSIGIGQWFRYVTGSIEVVSALLVPAWAAFGALLLIPTMAGAVAPICSSSAGLRCPQPCCSSDPSRSRGHVVTSWRACYRGGTERPSLRSDWMVILLRHTDAGGYR